MNQRAKDAMKINHNTFVLIWYMKRGRHHIKICFFLHMRRAKNSLLQIKNTAIIFPISGQTQHIE